MKIQYPIKGIFLKNADLAQIHSYYEAACTAEYLLDNYQCVTTEEQAMKLGHEVRRRMIKYGYDESEAIDLVLEECCVEDEDAGREKMYEDVLAIIESVGQNRMAEDMLDDLFEYIKEHKEWFK